MKNFVLESKPEVYSFSSPHDTEQFDITDDVSGECHEWARERIPMYVNECDADKVHPTMHAHNDPEGHIHYLFGHKHTKKPLELPKDVEMEVFVNYGPDYEEVRVRLGYSFLNDEGEVNRLQEKMKLGPMDCLTSITQTFDIYSINENIDFFSRHLSRFLAINNNKILHHILAVCLLLRHRAKMVQGEKIMLAEVRRGSDKIISSILGCNGTREMQEYEKIGEEEQLIREVIKILFLHYPHVSKHSVDHFLDGLSFVREV